MKKKLVFIPFIFLVFIFIVNIFLVPTIGNKTVQASVYAYVYEPELLSFELKINQKFRSIAKVDDAFKGKTFARNVWGVMAYTMTSHGVEDWNCNQLFIGGEGAQDPPGIPDNLTWFFGKRLGNTDIGFTTIKKVDIVMDRNGDNIVPKILNLTFLILPENYQCFSEQYLGINNNYKNIKISLSNELNETTINMDNIELYESTGTMNVDFVNDVNPYSFTKLTNYTLSLSEDKKVIIINKNVFEQNKNYHVVVKDTVEDVNGLKLSNPMWINFTYKDSVTNPGFVNMDI